MRKYAIDLAGMTEENRVNLVSLLQANKLLVGIRMYTQALAYIAELEAQIKRITNVQNRTESKSS